MEYIQAKTILQKNYGNYDNWFGINYNMNLYKGCSHGCIYCDSRSNCYHIDNFDKVRIKKDCIRMLNNELKKARHKGVVGIGAMSDTYNPFEKDYEITREALKLIKYYGFGVAIDTKSTLIQRDIDLLQDIKKNAPVIIKFTITTADDNLSKKIEPNVATSSERFKALNKLANEGIYTGVLLTPILPYITDTNENITNIIRLAKDNGAKFVYTYFSVTLRENQRNYYYSKLDSKFKGLKEKYMQIYGNNYICNSNNKSIINIFKEECNKYNLKYKMNDIIEEYKKDYNNTNEQISFI